MYKCVCGWVEGWMPEEGAVMRMNGKWNDEMIEEWVAKGKCNRITMKLKINSRLSFSKETTQHTCLAINTGAGSTLAARHSHWCICIHGQGQWLKASYNVHTCAVCVSGLLNCSWRPVGHHSSGGKVTGEKGTVTDLHSNEEGVHEYKVSSSFMKFSSQWENYKTKRFGSCNSLIG